MYKHGASIKHGRWMYEDAYVLRSDHAAFGHWLSVNIFGTRFLRANEINFQILVRVGEGGNSSLFHCRYFTLESRILYSIT